MLKDFILQNGGATVNSKGEAVTLKSGYQVSHKDVGRITVADFTEKMAQDMVALIDKRGEYAGFWVDGGFVYADLSRRVGTKKDAMALGKKLNQLAIWDWKNSCGVACN